MSSRNKRLVTVTTDDGYQVKAWQNRKGRLTPTNWKIQAGYLSGSVPITKRLKNRKRRRQEERLAWHRANMQKNQAVAARA